MAERQAFGFLIEKEIIKKEQLLKSETYTAEYDAFTSDNIPVQIKTVKNNQAICMGDIKRNFTKKKPFILYVYNYFSNKNKSKLYKIYVDDFSKYNELFYFDDYEMFWNELSALSNDREMDSQWKVIRLKYKKLFNSVERITSMNPKRDHKNQKRIQCSIPRKKFDIFLDLFKYEIINTEGYNETI